MLMRGAYTDAVITHSYRYGVLLMLPQSEVYTQLKSRLDSIPGIVSALYVVV